jgi:hypothetical protein
VWNPIPVFAGAEAALVVGQATFTDATIFTTPRADTLRDPAGVWTDGTRLAIADQGNSRVLLFNTLPTQNGASAHRVLGQAGFTAKDGCPNTPNASCMDLPTDVFFDGERFYVVDAGRHRIMVWNGWPTTNNQPADYFIGQPTGTTSNENAGGVGPNAIGLNFPRAVAVAGNNLFVADTDNHRVVVFTPIPTSSGEAASRVLGQLSLTASDAPAATANRMAHPYGLAVIGDKLFVSDTQNHRVLRFQLTQ